MNKIFYVVLVFLSTTIISYSQDWLSEPSKTCGRYNAGLTGSEGATSGFFQAANYPPGSLAINYPNNNLTWWHLLDIRHTNAGNNYAMQFAGEFLTSNLYFRKTADNPSTPWSRVLLETNGFVGIGTLTPSQALDVSGNIYSNGKILIGTSGLNTGAHSLAVNGSAIFTKAIVKSIGNWPDYVFDEKYKLLPLSDLEKFISKNKHLPGVPSFREVEKDGLDLGNNQAVLLKKIEELSLYLIEQSNELKAQKKQIIELTRKLKLYNSR